jgi:hypothetical protein
MLEIFRSLNLIIFVVIFFIMLWVRTIQLFSVVELVESVLALHRRVFRMINKVFCRGDIFPFAYGNCGTFFLVKSHTGLSFEIGSSDADY